MKFIKYILALLGAVFVINAEAQNFQSASFLNGFSFQVSATATNLYNTTNTYANRVVVTNVLVNITNSANGLVIQGYLSTNQPVFVTNTAAIQDCDLWEDRDGTVPAANISCDIVGTNSAFTNVITFYFASIANVNGYIGGPAPLPGTTAQNLFSFSVTGTGTTNAVVATNLPSNFMTGVRRIRLLSVGATNAGTNGVVNGIWLNGYHPVGDM